MRLILLLVVVALVGCGREKSFDEKVDDAKAVFVAHDQLQAEKNAERDARYRADMETVRRNAPKIVKGMTREEVIAAMELEPFEVRDMGSLGEMLSFAASHENETSILTVIIRDGKAWRITSND